MSNLLKKLLAFLSNLFKTLLAKIHPPVSQPESTSTPVQPSPPVPAQERPQPATNIPKTPTTFAEWIQANHPEATNIIPALVAQASPYLAGANSNFQFVWDQIHTPTSNPTPVDSGVPADWGHATEIADLPQNIPVDLLQAVHSIVSTQDHENVIAALQAAGFSRNDTAGIIAAYGPGGTLYGLPPEAFLNYLRTRYPKA